MIATTRSARRTPSSTSLVSSLASATEWMGTLRTSMAAGTAGSFLRRARVGGYDARAGVTGHGGGEVVEGGDDAGPAGVLGEAHHCLHLRSHGPGSEVLLGR